MSVPFAFANLSGSIALAKLDSNFNTPITIGNTSVLLGNTVTTLNNLTLANVTITSGTSNVTNANVTSINVTNLTATLANITTLNVASSYVTASNVATAVIGNLTLSNFLTVPNGGTGVATSTGSGSVVLSTSPTLVTPVLGTPTSGNLVNCTFPTLNQNTTGSAGSVANVLTISSPLSGTSFNGSAATTIALSSNYGDTQNPYASKTANYILAAPNGSNGVPTFRAIVAADIPTLNQNTTGTAAGLSATLAVGSGGTGATTLTGVLKGNGTSAFTAAAAGTDYQAPITLTTTGTSGAATFVSNVLNIPQYAGGGGGVTTFSAGTTGLTPSTATSGAITLAGTLAVANGGTGVTTSTGTTSVVLSTSPTITTPVISGNTTVNGLRLGNGISSGANNTVFGLNAGNAQTTGIANTLVGMNAGISLTSGTQNTFFGRSAGTGVTTQNNNTCIGYNTGIGPIGAGNTAIGYRALVDTTSTTATFNTSVGYQALATLNTYTNCSGLGADAAVTGDNQIQLGDSATTTYVYGTVQNRSDLRDKADVRDTQLGLAFVNALRPVDYKLDMRDDYKPARPDDVENAEAMAAWREASKIENLTHDGSKKRSRFHHGLIAQEVKAVLDAQGIDFGGFQDHKIAGGNDVLTIGYDELIAPLIKSIQELTARIAQLESK